MFLKRSVEIDFAIMKANKGNIVLGRDFLWAMKDFIDIGKGQIRLRGKEKGTYLFPWKNKDDLIENPFEILGEPSDDFEELWSSALSLANGYKEALSGGSPQRI